MGPLPPILLPESAGRVRLPHIRPHESSPEAKPWAALEAAADQKVLSSFPQLANPPPHHQKPVKETPYRLYKHIAPLSDIDESRSIVFIGQINVGNYFRAVEAQSMWATAYLDKKLALPKAEERQEEVALFTAWCRRRYLNNGEKGNWMTFELVGYTDRLLEQLGLRTHRKGWFRDLFEPCRAADFKGLKDEYLEKYEKKKANAVDEGKSWRVRSRALGNPWMGNVRVRARSKIPTAGYKAKQCSSSSSMIRSIASVTATPVEGVCSLKGSSLDSERLR